MKFQSKKQKTDDSIKDNGINDDEYILLDTNEPEKEITVNKGEPISVAKLYAKRENTIQSYKQRIGLLASTLLENPDLKVNVMFIYIYTHMIIMDITVLKYITFNLILLLNIALLGQCL